VRRGVRAGALVLALAVACGPSSLASATPTPTPDGTTPPFFQLQLIAKAAQYQVTLKPTSSVQGGGVIGEQLWSFKQGKARFDFVAGGSPTTNVSLFELPSGSYACVGPANDQRCASIDESDASPWRNPAAFYQSVVAAHPGQFTGVATGIRHLIDEHGHCYDVHHVPGSLPDSHLCYTLQGIPMALRVAAETGSWSLEATSVTRSVPDSLFTLPAAVTAP